MYARTSYVSKGCAGGSADPARHHGLLRLHSSMCSVCPSWVSILLAPPAEATLLCFVLSDFGPAGFKGVAPAVLPTVYSTVCGSELCVCVYIALSSVKYNGVNNQGATPLGGVFVEAAHRQVAVRTVCREATSTLQSCSPTHPSSQG